MSRPRVPGAALLHPLPWAAALVMVFNLVYLKARHPGWWSGKLSDFAICFFLPVVLCAAYEWAAWVVAGLRDKAWGSRDGISPGAAAAARLERGAPWLPGTGVVTAACLVSAAYFSALQLWQPAAELHVEALQRLVPGRLFAVTPDPTDLVALPMTALAWLWLSARGRGA